MILRSQVRGGRSSTAIPDVEVRPEMEFRQEPEIDNRAEIEVSVSTTCEKDLGATGPITGEKYLKQSVSTYRVIDQKQLLRPVSVSCLCL